MFFTRRNQLAASAVKIISYYLENTVAHSSFIVLGEE